MVIVVLRICQRQANLDHMISVFHVLTPQLLSHHTDYIVQ